MLFFSPAEIPPDRTDHYSKNNMTAASELLSKSIKYFPVFLRGNLLLASSLSCTEDIAPQRNILCRCFYQWAGVHLWTGRIVWKQDTIDRNCECIHTTVIYQHSITLWPMIIQTVLVLKQLWLLTRHVPVYCTDALSQFHKTILMTS